MLKTFMDRLEEGRRKEGYWIFQSAPYDLPTYEKDGHSTDSIPEIVYHDAALKFCRSIQSILQLGFNQRLLHRQCLWTRRYKQYVL